MLIKGPSSDVALPIFTKNLKSLMDMHGVNAAELSRRAEIPYQTLVSILNGNTHNPGIDLLDKLVRFFKVTADSLLGIDDRVLKKDLEIVRVMDPKLPKIPLIQWEEIIYWVAQGFNYLGVKHEKWVSCNINLSGLGFALQIWHRSEGYDIFPVNSIIIIDPEKDYVAGDYVIASIRGNKPVIKQIANGEGVRYLIPLKATLPVEKLELDNQVLGTIVEYRINIKGDHLKKKEEEIMDNLKTEYPFEEERKVS
ncbi:hypothetical protein AYO37_00700 [Opitutia bacterium SCGC AG-212-L18]|nr:hypothetical protein AYO37_00700 [Opitutae bacterium SCGC AG-212-L18]